LLKFITHIAEGFTSLKLRPCHIWIVFFDVAEGVNNVDVVLRPHLNKFSLLNDELRLFLGVPAIRRTIKRSPSVT
jgi:hypothetical protein